VIAGVSYASWLNTDQQDSKKLHNDRYRLLCPNELFCRYISYHFVKRHSAEGDQTEPRD